MSEEIMEQAMNIILFAGDARTYCERALNAIADFNFADAKENLALCEQHIIEAHTIHTKIVQREAAGETFDYMMLFAHAQDTLMTIASEIHLTKKLLNMYRVSDERFKNLEK